MAQAALETWHVVCVQAPPRPPAHPRVRWDEHAPGSPLYATAVELTGGQPVAVVTVAARLISAGPVLAYATALAAATGGRLLSDPPAPWAVREVSGATAELSSAWAELVRVADEDAAAAGHEGADWAPSSDDDWSDVNTA